jgi:hypothetical protein
VALFPTTGILDDFNRADGPVGANWTDLGFPITIVTNRASQAGASNHNLWNVSTFGPDLEVYLTRATAGAINSILYIVMNMPEAFFDGYKATYNKGTCSIQRVDVGIVTQLGASMIPAPAMPDNSTAGVSFIGSKLTLLYTDSTNTWITLDSRYDSTYKAVANIGWADFFSTEYQDNFGGGTYVPQAKELDRHTARGTMPLFPDKVKGSVIEATINPSSKLSTHPKKQLRDLRRTVRN